MEDAMEREVDKILAGSKLDPGCEVEGEHGTISPSDRYLLVEESRVTGRVWLSGWLTKEGAASYHDGQEGDDWKVRELVDVQDGKHYMPVEVTGWEEA